MVKKKLRILLDDEAKNALRNIYNYIKKRESIERAKKVRDEIVYSSKLLNDFPEKFEKEPVLRDEPSNFRYKVIYCYKIIYEITSESI